MKTLLHYLCVLFCTLVCSVTGYSQITYSQNFDNYTQGNWSYGFSAYNDNGCGATTSLRGNFYYTYSEWDGEYYDYPASTVSPALGLSNGQLVTVNYNYKLLQYGTVDTATPNSPSWGSVELQYGTSDTGPWTTFQTINTTNHIVSSNCVAKTATFTPPAGSQVYIRVNATTGQNLTDVNVFIDDVVVTQAVLGCTGTPAVATTVAANASICNQQSAQLSLTPAYFTAGLTYQWQKSTDGTTYANISGATAVSLTATQTVNTWYRAIVTCVASTLSSTSTPVQVTNNGLNCTCPVEFANSVEPITNVTFASINNTTSPDVNGTPDVQNFAGIVAPALVYKESTYPISLQGNTDGTSYTTYFKVYIDFNQNGNFDEAGEGFEIGSVTGSTGTDGQVATGNILIPATALTGITNMRVFKLYNAYPLTSCGTDFGYGQVEDYQLNIQPCGTLAPVADANQSVCAGATLADIAITGTTIKWYAAETGGSPLGGNTVVVDGTIYYASSTSGCESATRTPVTVTINTPLADDPADVAICSDYVLPTLTNGAYYTATGGQGTALAAGDVITENTTLYVYTVAGTCTAENSFTITVNAFEVDELEDVTVCSEYILPELTSGTYYTGGSGLGEMLEAGAAITETMTLHIYGVSSENPACTAETSFTVTVVSAIADEMDDVATCSDYTLPELSAGNNYYTMTGGEGSMLNAGDVVSSSQTIYIYAQAGSSPVCTDETSFEVIVTPLEGPGDITVVIEENDSLPTYYPIYDIDLGVVLEGTITYYATEADAENGVNALDETEIVVEGTTTYYATITNGDCTSEPFAVTFDIVLSADSFDMAVFSYHPNPVTDVLNLSYSENITGVQVLNLLGQQVLSGSYSSDKVQLDLSQLASGTYMVKVSTENASKIIKVIRE